MFDPCCYACRHGADPEAPQRERILRTAHWRAAHAPDTSLPGWLVLVPLDHVLALDELAPAAAQELGPLLRGLTSALRAVTGCEKTYVFLLAEAEGFAHLHFHVVPRAPGLPSGERGPRVLARLDDGARRVPLEEQEAISRRVAAAMP